MNDNKVMTMNVFKMIFSGWRGYKEEFSSQMLAFLLSPHMPHNLGASFLRGFLELARGDAAKKGQQSYKLIEEVFPLLDTLPIKMEYYCTNILNMIPQEKPGAELGAPRNFMIQLEAHPKKQSKGRIDILMKIGRVYFIIENKIYEESIGDVELQLADYRVELAEAIKTDDMVLISILPSATGVGQQFIALTWFDIAGVIDGLVCCSQVIKDFSEYLKDGYKPYPNHGIKYEPPKFMYDEYMARYTKADKIIVDRILKDWASLNDKCVYDNRSIMCDGPILWFPSKIKSNGMPGKSVWPFRINNSGTLVVQCAQIKHIAGLSEKLINKLRENDTIKNAMGVHSSLPIKSMSGNEEMLAHLYATFMYARDEISKIEL